MVHCFLGSGLDILVSFSPNRILAPNQRNNSYTFHVIDKRLMRLWRRWFCFVNNFRIVATQNEYKKI